MEKVDFPIDKNEWHPSLIPGVIALISTLDLQGNPNIAPKSWIQMVSFKPSALMFSGTKGGTTENNIEKTGCFGVNFVHSSLAAVSYECIRWFGKERIEKSGLTLENASKIKAPLVKECNAHLECELLDTREIGSGYVIFGEIVAASIREDILLLPPEERYKRLDEIVFLENNIFSTINNIESIPPKIN